MKMKAILLLAIASAAALVTQPVRATAIQTLVITEFSSTSLTALLNGTTSLTVTPIGADDWSIALTGVGGFHNNWVEPDAAGFINGVSFSIVQPDQLFVVSDFSNSSGGLANNTADTSDFTLNGVELDVTFNDKGDVAAAPDTGSTLGLLSLSVIALLGATRFRSLRLA
jgi:hypothetical protein